LKPVINFRLLIFS